MPPSIPCMGWIISYLTPSKEVMDKKGHENFQSVHGRNLALVFGDHQLPVSSQFSVSVGPGEMLHTISPLQFKIMWVSLKASSAVI